MSEAEEYRQHTREEWREAMDSVRRARGADRHRVAIETCKRLLKESAERDNVPRETPEPCEHDYQPSSTYLEALECTICHTTCQAPERDRDWFDEANKGKL